MQKFQTKFNEFLDVAAKYVPSPKFMSGCALVLVTLLAVMQIHERDKTRTTLAEIKIACDTVQHGIDKLEYSVGKHTGLSDDIRLVRKSIDRIESKHRDDQERFTQLVARVDQLNVAPSRPSRTEIVTAPAAAPTEAPTVEAPAVEEPVEEVIAEAKPKRRWYYLWIY